MFAMIDLISFTSEDECIEYIKENEFYEEHSEYATHFYLTYDAGKDEILFLDTYVASGGHSYMMASFNPLGVYPSVTKLIVSDGKIVYADERFEELFDNPWYESDISDSERDGRERELYYVLQTLSKKYLNDGNLFP